MSAILACALFTRDVAILIFLPDTISFIKIFRASCAAHAVAAWDDSARRAFACVFRQYDPQPVPDVLKYPRLVRKRSVVKC